MKILKLKRRIWLALLLVLGLLGFVGLRLMSDLFLLTAKADALESALNIIEPRKAEPGLLRWGIDDPTPRLLEPFRRDEITSDYRLAHEELSYALLTADTVGLPSYFQSGALEDALKVAQQGRKGMLLDWDHQLKLHFYAPDGGTVAFTDTYWYVQSWLNEDGFGSIRLAQRQLEVVMFLDDGTWRIHHWRVLAEKVPQSKPIAVQTKHIRGINYQPRSAPFEMFGAAYDPREVVSDLRIAQTLGLDTVRVFLPYPVPAGSTERLKSFLDIAQQLNVRVLLTLLDGYTRYQLQDLPKMIVQINDLTSLLRHPAVWAIDVKNEPDRDFESAQTNNVREFLKLMVGYVRTISNKPITVGLIEPDPVLSPELDFVSLHHYGSIPSLRIRLEQSRRFGKPILLQEFGFHTQTNKLPDPHTPKEQAAYYQDVLELSREMEAGWLAWTLYDLPKGTMPGGREVERHLGILFADARLKPSAEVIMGKKVSPPTMLERILKILPLAAVGLIGMLGLSLVLGLWVRHIIRKIPPI